MSATEPRSESEIADWSVQFISVLLEVPVAGIKRTVKFSRIGLDSAMLVYLLAGLEEWLAIEIDPDVAFEHPTIDQLARHLAAKQ
jgi:acyl carrier protein